MQEPHLFNSINNNALPQKGTALFIPPQIQRHVAETKHGGRSHEEEDIAIRRSVKGLHFGGREEKEAAAETIKYLAKTDACKKRALMELGVIPSLVSMLVDAKEGSFSQRLSLEALVELANGSFTNKMIIANSNLLTKVPKLQTKTDLSMRELLVTLLLSISSLAKSQFSIDPLHILSFLLDTLRCPSPPTGATVLAIATILYNLSTQLNNAKSIISSGAVNPLLNLCLHANASEAALATLKNLSLTEDGKKAIEEDSLVPGVLLDAMSREESPKCQELSAYLLMLVARRSAKQRRRMVEMGVVEMAVEVALMGRSRIVRERALRMLGWFKDGINGEMGEEDEKLCREEIGCLVKQSLDRNMESMCRRGGN